MTMLVGRELQLLHLYDLQQDPDERRDLLAEDDFQALVAPLINILVRERSEILEMRGALASLSQQEWRLAH